LDTIDTLADDLDLIVAQFRERVAYLKAFSWVTQNNEIIHLVE
jgi:hypothetical protein